MRARQRFAPRGVLAIAPHAIGAVFDVADREPPSQRDGVAVLTIRGPLMHHADCFDNYESIKARVMNALAGGPRALVLAIDSPGGLVSGCFETSRELRTMAAAAGVPLVAYVDGCATSAAYALACSASSIYVPASGIVGSIGVIDALADTTALDAAMGLRVAIITSGARKADGNPHVPIADDAVAAAQQRVDGLAELFFALVADARGLSVDAVRALEAGMVHGAEAVRQGLADAVVGSLDELLATLASGANGVAMATEYEEAVSKLRKAAEGDDDEAKRAQRMLAAMDDEEEASAESEEDEDDKEPPPAAASDDEDKEESSARGDVALKALAEVHSLRAEISKEKREAKRAAERALLLASRPDFAPELVAVLQTAPLATVRKMVTELKKGPVRPKAVATTTVAATRGETQVDREASALPPDQAHELDVQMGLATAATGIRIDGNRQILGVMTRAQARAELARRTKQQVAG